MTSDVQDPNTNAVDVSTLDADQMRKYIWQLEKRVSDLEAALAKKEER
jgi:hypothetical protein